MKVLIVDDNYTTRRMVHQWFDMEFEGYTLIEAENGNEVLGKVEKESPDLIILDIMLPGINGLDLLEMLKTQHPSLPIILFSAYGCKELLEKAIDFGVDGFVDKPIDFKKFKQKINSVMEKYELMRENTRLRKELEKSEEKYRTLIENSRDGIFRLDNEERITFANQKILEWTGLSADELIGSRFEDMQIIEDSNYHEQKSEKSTDGFLYNMTLLTDNGNRYVLEVSARWLKEDNKVLGMEGIARDVTSKKILEQKLERQRIKLEAILNSIADAILAYDSDYKIITVNKQMQRMIGVKEYNLIGMSLHRFISQYSGLVKLTPEISEIRRQIEENVYESIKFEAEIKSSGKICEVRYHPIIDYEKVVSGSLLVFHDITQQRFMERMREDLSSMLVHDLKNPLSAIIMYTNILVREVDHPRQKDLLKKINMTSNELLKMIMDLLDVHKLEEGLMCLEKKDFDLHQTIQKVYEQMEIMRHTKKLQIELDFTQELPSITGDQERIYRVVSNLIGNAIKFTPTGGVVRVSTWTDESQRNIFFSVADTGMGIPKEFQNKIFDKFVQVKSRQEGQKLSTGLGLTYCKLAVEAHGGEIWLDSEVGAGTTFLVRLPT